jgi:PTS system cellobiose-specific IIA component
LDEQENLQVVMGLILNGGNAKSSAVTAIKAAKKGDFVAARAQLKEADKFLVAAHNSQTQMLTQEANGQHQPVDLLMVHGQDHLMNAITFRDLASEIIDIYQRLAEHN